MFKRLLECKKSIYSKQKFLKSYRQSQTYKKNVCKYPSINFYKTQKTSYYFATLNSPTNKPLLNINNLFKEKPKLSFRKQNLYKNIFFTKQIAEGINDIANNNNNNNKNKNLLMDNINTNINAQRKANQYSKTFYAVKDNYDNQYQKTNYNLKNYFFNNENYKTNYNNKMNLFKRGKSERILSIDNNYN